MDYVCSGCKAQLSSEGIEASEHMINEHGVDPENPFQEGNPHLIPLESNPVAVLEEET